jgi:hypothetical protein
MGELALRAGILPGTEHPDRRCAQLDRHWRF